MKKVVASLGLAFCLKSWAGIIIDIYGTNAIEGEKILKKYSQEIIQIENFLFKVSMQSKIKNENYVMQKMLRKESIKEIIKKEYNFSLVDFQTIIYPDKKL